MRSIYLKNKEAYNLILGTSIAQAIPFLFSPILSRLYSPAEYTLLGILLSTSNLLVEFTNFKFARAIVLEEEIEGSKNLLLSCIFFSFFTSAITFLAFSFLESYIIGLKIHSEIQTLKVSLPLIVLAMGISVSSNFWFQRKHTHYRMTSNKLVQMIGITLFSVLFGYYAIKNGLILGYILGWMIVMFFTFYQLLKTDFSFKKINIYEIIGILKKYSYFPKYSLFPSVFHILALTLPYIMFSKMFGEELGGHFNMCKQMLIIPLGFISAGFTQIYFRKLAENYTQKTTILPLLKTMLKPILLFGGLTFLVVFFFGEFLFSLVLGENWNIAGQFSQIYIFAAILNFFGVSLMILFPVLNKIKQESIFKLSYFVCITLLFLMKFDDAFHFIYYYTIFESILFGSLIFYVFFAIRKYEKSI